MMQAEDDYWLDLGHAADAVPSVLPSSGGDEISGVEPLGDQFGVWPQKTVPDTLQAPLFGSLADGCETVLGCFAILDGAKIANLPEVLTASGLPHRCLFQGDAFDTLGDAAPWIVQLEAGSSLTRQLFTQGAEPTQFWDREPGLYLRSSQGLDALWQHFRTFARVRNSQGEWVVFRFWEPHVAQACLEAGYLRYFHGSEQQMVAAVICCNVLEHCTLHHAPEHPDTAPACQLSRAQEQAMAQAVARRRRIEMALALRRSFPEQTADRSRDDLHSMVEQVVQRMSVYGIRKLRSIHVLASWQLFFGERFEQRDPAGQLIQILAGHLDEDAKLAQLERRMDVLHETGAL